jgi:hypothetical protein
MLIYIPPTGEFQSVQLLSERNQKGINASDGIQFTADRKEVQAKRHQQFCSVIIIFFFSNHSVRKAENKNKQNIRSR